MTSKLSRAHTLHLSIHRIKLVMLLDCLNTTDIVHSVTGSN